MTAVWAAYVARRNTDWRHPPRVARVADGAFRNDGTGFVNVAAEREVDGAGRPRVGNDGPSVRRTRKANGQSWIRHCSTCFRRAPP